MSHVHLHIQHVISISTQNGGHAWGVNTKLAAGMITMQYCMYLEFLQ